MISVLTLASPPFVRTDHSISVHGSSRMEVPRHSNRWVQTIRGPRPPSVQWPRVGQQSRQPVQHGPRQSPTNRPKSVQAKSSGLRPFQDLSVKAAAAKERLSKLETPLSAMDGMEGPEVDMVRNAYKRALEAVRGAPIDVQVKECESFLARARSHLEELDCKRATIIQNIESSEKRLEELRAQQTTTSPPDGSSEVHQLRGRVAQLQAQVDSLRTVPSVDYQGPNPKRTCRREEFVPHCDEEMQEWIEGRQRDLQAAILAGQLPEVARISQLLSKAAQEWQQIIEEQAPGMPSAVANVVVIRVRCGMTGVRVGEAANPGPGQSRRRRRVSSSDEVVGVASSSVAVEANPGPHHRRRRVCSDGSESGFPGAVVHHDLTLIDSSDDDAPFTAPRPAAFARPSHRLVLVPESAGGHSTVNPGP